MSIGTTVRTAVVADSTLNTLVGTRVYPLNYPSGVTFPCITYRVISGYSEEIPSGDVYRTRIQFDIWSYSYDDNEEVKDALAALFNMADMTVSGQHIIKGKSDLVFDLYEEQTSLYRMVVDFVFMHEGT